jgi:hypothetical protein
MKSILLESKVGQAGRSLPLESPVAAKVAHLRGDNVGDPPSLIREGPFRGIEIVEHVVDFRPKVGGSWRRAVSLLTLGGRQIEH